MDNFTTCKQIKLDDFPFHETTVNVTLTDSHLGIIRFLIRNIYYLIVYKNICFNMHNIHYISNTCNLFNCDYNIASIFSIICECFDSP